MVRTKKVAKLESPSSHSSTDDEEKKIQQIQNSEIPTQSTRLQAIRIGMKRALTATSILTFATLNEDENLKPTISHPLLGVPRRKLYQRVTELAEEFDLLEDLEVLKKGARVAQKGKDWRLIEDELSEEDIKVFGKVESCPWSQTTWPLVLTVAAASFGALTLGWDQGVLSGATLHYPKDMHIDPDVAGPHQAYYNWLTGIVSAGPFLGAAGLSVWLSDIVNHYAGRKGCLYLASIFLLLCPIGSAFTYNWEQLLICRILLGLGIGFLEVTAPVFAAESAPQEIRGAMTINFQLFTALGILCGSSTNLMFEGVKHNWRYMLGSPMLPVPIMLLLLYLCPESARWYLKWGKVHEAYLSLKKLRHNDLLAARDLYLIRTQMIEEQNAIGGSRNLRRFAELFYKNRVRQSTVASCIAHFAQVLSGVNIVCLFSSTIFTELTQRWGGGGNTVALVGQHATSNINALLGSWGFGIVNFVFTLPAMWSIDRLGRRKLMLMTLPNLFWTLLAAGLCFLISDQSHPSLALGLVLTFIYLFTAFYSVGMGPIAICYSAESAAQTHRELSVALAAFVNNGINALLSITFFRMRQVFTTTGVFGFYAGLNLGMLVLVFALVPETKQLSLEELDAVFAHPNREFMGYQFGKALPYYWRKFVLRQQGLTLKPLSELHHIENLRG